MAPHSSTLAWKIPWTEEPGAQEWWGHCFFGVSLVVSCWLVHLFLHPGSPLSPKGAPTALPSQAGSLQTKLMMKLPMGR